jgi:hypothetical protein
MGDEVKEIADENMRGVYEDGLHGGLAMRRMWSRLDILHPTSPEQGKSGDPILEHRIDLAQSI